MTRYEIRIMWMFIILAVLFAASVGILIYSVIDLHARDIQTDDRICAAEQADRLIDQQIIEQARLRIPVPPLAGICP